MPAQRYLVLDLCHMAEHDLPPRNLLRAVVGLEQSRAPLDLLRVVQALLDWQPNPRTVELQRAFTDWVRQMAQRLAPAGAAMRLARIASTTTS